MPNTEMEATRVVHAGRGEMIAVASAKGGIGRTVTAVNLAVALSKNNRLKISVLDGDFQFGDVGLAMDLHPSFTMKDVVESLEGMDRHSIQSYLIHHSSGVRVLAAPERPEHAELVTPAVIEKVCGLLLQQHDYVIADTGVGLHEQSLALIEKADQVFVLTTLEMTAIKNTRQMLETLELLGLRHKAHVVVNRSTMESVIKPSDVADILGAEQPIYVPNDFQTVAQSINIGVPFVLNHAKTDVAKSIFRMAEQLISRREIALFKPKQPSLLQSLFGKAKAKGGTTSMF